MLHFAICDDQPISLRQINELLQNYLQARPTLQGRVVSFTSGESLLAHVQAEHGFDVYILDILMPRLNGIKTGQHLRQSGESGEIIYLTNSNEFAADSYDVQAFFYLLKPVDAQKFFTILDQAVDKAIRRRNCIILVQTNQGTLRLSLEHILYVERVGRVIRYYCTDGIIDSQTLHMPFRQAVEPLLSDSRFYLCGASFALNFQHVCGVNGQNALLDDGTCLTLPRRSAADFKRNWGKYWLNKNNNTCYPPQ